MDFQKALIAELKSLITINEAGKKKTVSKLEAILKHDVARSFHDKAMRKDLLNWTAKLPKEAFIDGEVYTFKVTQSTLDLWEKIEQDVATWNSSEASKKPPDD